MERKEVAEADGTSRQREGEREVFFCVAKMHATCADGGKTTT